MTLTVLSKIMEIIVKSYSLIRVEQAIEIVSITLTHGTIVGERLFITDMRVFACHSKEKIIIS